jgi:serine/threonine protein kinase
LRSSVADYAIIRALPASNFGQTRYLCRAPERLGIDEPVMVTELSVDASGWRDLASRLSTLATIGSPHLLTLFEVGPDLDPEGAGVYLTSESAPGGSAQEASRRDQRTMVGAVAAAARGADAMHSAGVAHGAIDAGAILFTARGPALTPPPLGGPSGVVARAHGWKDLAVLDPDLLRGEAPSRSSDVWSLAATLHGLLSSRPLYPDINADGEATEPIVTTVQRVLFTRPEVDPSLPPPLAAVLSRCFAADPSDRFATAAELADELSRPAP